MPVSHVGRPTGASMLCYAQVLTDSGRIAGLDGAHRRWQSFDEKYLKPYFGGRSAGSRDNVRASLSLGRGQEASDDDDSDAD